MITVKKYGGTSLANPKLIKHVAAKVALARSLGESPVVVVSAMAGETEKLIALANEVFPGAHGREFAILLSSGERVSSALLALALRELGVPSVVFSGRTAGIFTDTVYQRAKIRRVEATRVKEAVEKRVVPVVMGFQGINAEGETTTLDRGGSDDTAVWLAAALNAAKCEIFTDVNGVFTTDPNLCPRAKLLPALSFEEMMEMAALGAKVLQLSSVENASRLGVNLIVKHAHHEGDGTYVSHSNPNPSPLTGIAFRRGNFWLKLLNSPYETAFARDLATPLRKMNIEVDMLAKSLGKDNRATLSFIVGNEDFPLTNELLREPLKKYKRVELDVKPDMARLSVVGEAVADDALLAKRIYDYLKPLDIPIYGISMTGMALTMLIEDKKLSQAVNELHSLLGLDIVTHP